MKYTLGQKLVTEEMGECEVVGIYELKQFAEGFDKPSTIYAYALFDSLSINIFTEEQITIYENQQEPRDRIE